MTITPERQKVIEKVVKLLTLAESTNHIAERETASTLAAELMAKYEISLGDVKKEEFEFVDYDTGVKTHYPERSRMIRAIGRFNGVTIILYSGDELSHTSYRLVGRPVDIEVVKFMYDIIRQQQRVARAEHIQTFLARYGRRARQLDGERFDRGFALGVEALLWDLTKATQTKKQEWGLVKVTSMAQVAKDALLWYKETHRIHPGGSMRSGGSRDGYDAGKSVSLYRGVSAPTGGPKGLGR